MLTGKRRKTRCITTAAIIASVALATLYSMRLAYAGDSLIPHRPNTIARFDFDGNAQDTSGHNRHARLLGGSFVRGYGGAVRIKPKGGSGQVGLDWSEHAGYLQHPYIIEIVLEPAQTNPWGKILGFSDSSDHGWYYKRRGIQAYPHQVLGAGQLADGELHYLAFVSRSASEMEVFIQGESVGVTPSTFTAPPGRLYLFSDDTYTQRQEQLDVIVHALNIASGSTTEEELTQRWGSVRNRESFMRIKMMLDAIHAQQELLSLPEAAMSKVNYRRGLLSRYMKIQALYDAQRAVDIPGVPEPNVPDGRRPLRAAEMDGIALAYGKLLLEDPPQHTGVFASRLGWRDANGRTIYFATDHEEFLVEHVLAMESIQNLRRRLRTYMKALAEGGVAGPMQIFPGLSVGPDVLTLVTGKNMMGEDVGLAGRFLAAGSLGVDLVPIFAGAIKHRIVMKRRVPHPLEQEIRNGPNRLRAQFRGVNEQSIGDISKANTRELMLVDYLRNVDELARLRGGSIHTSSVQPFDNNGFLNAQRGIDDYVVPRGANDSSIGVVRELKTKAREFEGWRSTSAVGLREARHDIPGIAAGTTDQASWTWFVDRAIQAHRNPVDNTTAARALDFLKRFSNGKVKRQVIVADSTGAVHVARETWLQSHLNEGSSLEALRDAVRAYLQQSGH